LLSLSQTLPLSNLSLLELIIIIWSINLAKSKLINPKINNLVSSYIKITTNYFFKEKKSNHQLILKILILKFTSENNKTTSNPWDLFSLYCPALRHARMLSCCKSSNSPTCRLQVAQQEITTTTTCMKLILF